MDDLYRQMARFIRKLRHDANNPLTAALGNVQLLLEDADQFPPDALESLQTIESELRRLMEILARLNVIREDAPPAAADLEQP